MRVSPHFLRSEFACKCGCGFDPVDITLNESLEDVRSHFSDLYPNKKITIEITSGNRCRRYNLTIPNASENSLHTVGKAADFIVHGVHADRVADYLEGKYEHWFGIGRYTGRTHLDTREMKARWDKRSLQ
jgi:uncharacterized protein YcbK (DUF882 family)